MQSNFFAGLILAGMSAAALALPLSAINVSIVESKTNSTLTTGAVERTGLNRIAEGGAERLLERKEDLLKNRALVVEGGAERLLDRQKELLKDLDLVAEGGAERLQERLRITEGGSERLLERQEDLLKNRVLVVEGGADRLQERLRVAEGGAERTGVNRVS